MTVDERLRTSSGSTRALAGRARESNRRLVVVSNRVGPIASGKASEGGLAVALRAALESRGGLWFGYSGSVSENPTEAIAQGLEMPVGERKERWAAMMTTLRRNDANAWRRSFVEELAAGARR